MSWVSIFDQIKIKQNSEATFKPFCFVAQIALSPENAAAAATSMATFSLTDHST
jgi:hypothetical protein